MAITATTQFTYVVLNCNWARSTVAMSVRVVDSTSQSWYFGAGAEENQYVGDADLQAVRDIWASDDGFQDGDGNDLAVSISGVHADLISTPADLEKIGLFNPLDADSYGRWKNAQEVQGAFVKHATVEEDSDTGRRDIKTQRWLHPCQAHLRQRRGPAVPRGLDG